MNEEITSENSQYKVYDNRKEAEDALTSNEWNNSLSYEENQAVKEYTGSAYTDFNGELRGYPPYMSESQREELHESIDNLTNALDRYELQENTVFHRGASPKLLGGAETVDEIRGMIGSVVVDKGFTSAGITIGESFYDKPLLFHIATSKGSGIGAYIGKQNSFGEKEFLFNRGSAFKITGAYEKGGQVNINMTYVGSTR